MSFQDLTKKNLAGGFNLKHQKKKIGLFDALSHKHIKSQKKWWRGRFPPNLLKR